MLMPERSTSTDSYRYAYNGMEMDDEVSGNGNSYTTEFRQYDARLGRWKSLDPLMGMFPHMSPYVAFDNNPIYYTDIYGLSSGEPIKGPSDATSSDSQKTFIFNLGDVDEGQEVIFTYINNKENVTIKYTYRDGNWSSASVRKSQYGGSKRNSSNFEGSVKNKLTETEYAAVKIIDKVSDSNSGTTVVQEIIKEKEKIVINKGKTYNTSKGPKDEFVKTKRSNENRLYNSNGVLRKKTSGTVKYERIKYIDNVTNKAGKLSRYSELGYDIVTGDVGAIAEELIIYGIDKLADRLLMTPTPATVALGVVIKGSLFIYENWEALESAYSWLLSTPVRKHYDINPYPENGIYFDNLNPLFFKPSSISP